MRYTPVDLTPKPYRLLKTDLAAKLSARSSGAITYQLLVDTTDTPQLHIAVTANEGGGLWSKEAVSLSNIEPVLAAYGDGPFPTKALRGAMVGRSSNNPPFLCAVLKDLGLIAPAPDKAHQHIKTGDWQAFREEWLSAPGEGGMYPLVVDGATEAPHATVVTQANNALPSKPTKGKRKKMAMAEVEATPPATEGVSDVETAHAD